MEQELKERLEKAHKESLDNPGKKKRGCSDCKKKPKEVKLEPVIEQEPIEIPVPTAEEINLAYAELTSFGGVKESAKPLIKRVYEYIFKEDFNFKCRSCVSNQARKFKFYLGK
jgi:hypothetical protein